MYMCPCIKFLRLDYEEVEGEEGFDVGVKLRFGQQVGGVGVVAVACVAVEADDVQIV